MPQYLIEREIPGAGNLTPEQLRDASKHSNSVPRKWASQRSDQPGHWARVVRSSFVDRLGWEEVLTASERPEAIHDFFGFPKAPFDVRHPAFGVRFGRADRYGFADLRYQVPAIPASSDS